jgi:hypothetical protein
VLGQTSEHYIGTFSACVGRVTPKMMRTVYDSGPMDPAANQDLQDIRQAREDDRFRSAYLGEAKSLTSYTSS